MTYSRDISKAAKEPDMTTNILTQTTTIDGIEATSFTIGRGKNVEGRTTWTVTLTGVDLLTEEPVETTAHYRTNRDGEGLWVGDQQILGTTQFHGTRAELVAYLRRTNGIEDAA